MTLRAVLLVCISVLCVSCVGAYVAPDRGSPQATLHIITNLPHATTSGWRYYADANCSDSSAVSLGAFSAMYEGQKKVQLLAGQKRYLVVKTGSRGGAPAYSCGGAVCISEKICVVEFEITPVAGRTYQARLLGDGYNCSVTLTDQATGARPAEARQLATTPGCK